MHLKSLAKVEVGPQAEREQICPYACTNNGKTYGYPNPDISVSTFQAHIRTTLFHSVGESLLNVLLE